MDIQDDLAEARRQQLSKDFFAREPLDDEQAQTQKRALMNVLDNSAIRYQEIIDRIGAIPVNSDDLRDDTVVYMWFRMQEYASQCLKVTTIYGLLPLVRAIYEHLVRMYWCILSEDNSRRYIEASRFRFLERSFLMYDRMKEHRERIKNNHSRHDIRTVRKEYEGWKGAKTQPGFKEMAIEAGFGETFADFAYPVFSERAHGSGWEEFNGGYTAAEEFILMLSAAVQFLAGGTDAAEDWLRHRKCPDASRYLRDPLA